jgi:hypothetical protein
LSASAAIEFEIAGQCAGVGAGLGQGLADIMGLEIGEPFDMILHRAADLGEQTAAFGRRHRAPVARQRHARGDHRGLDFGEHRGRCGRSPVRWKDLPPAG